MQIPLACDSRQQRRRDADRPDRLVRRQHLSRQPLNVGIDCAVRPLIGKCAQILRRPEPPGKYQRIDLRRPHVLDILDLPARDPRRFRQHIPALLRRLLPHVIDHPRLRHIRAISYGGRQEIVDAVRRLAERVQRGELPPSAIDEAAIHANLYHPDLPDPDLLIRTAGEHRISNFLLWQVSYAEIHVADVCWPDFGAEHLRAAFRDYGQRVRKFGKVT